MTYHPFWNNLEQHESAIDCIAEIKDYVAVHGSYESAMRVILGDFNDLKKYNDSITSETGSIPSVFFSTRKTKFLISVSLIVMLCIILLKN